MTAAGTTAGAPARLVAIDALRGLALLGILLVNQAAFRSGVAGTMPGGGLGAGWRTTAIDAAIQWLVAGKFILIFAFLFGWGVHTQASRGEGFRGRYLRRLLGLLLLGVVHATFLFAGDILAVYALIGFFMLRPVRRDWPVRKLVRSAAVLLAVQAVILLGIAAMVAASPPSDDVSFAEYARRSAQVYLTGDFWSVTVHRLGEFALFALAAPLALLGWGLLAMFRLGLAAARTFAAGGLEAMRPAARRVLWPALIGGLAANGVCAALAASLPESLASAASLLQVALFTPILSLGYLAAAVLILSTRAGERVTPLLGSAGRMSLSVYVGQSLIMSLLYHGYGLGLAGWLTSAGSVLVCLAVYAALVALSRLWLSVFRVGPLEWVLRSFTEWRWVAVRPRSDASAGVAAA
jgi:uncharacterized protein